MDIFKDEISTTLGLNVLSANSADELMMILKSIGLPIRILTIYGLNNRHFAWIKTDANIKKVLKKSDAVKSKE